MEATLFKSQFDSTIYNHGFSNPKDKVDNDAEKEGQAIRRHRGLCPNPKKKHNSY